MRRRGLARLLIVAGIALWIPELWIVWVVVSTLFVPLHTPAGLGPVQLHLDINPSAWVLLIGWTLACWALAGLGIRMLLKKPAPYPPPL